MKTSGNEYVKKQLKEIYILFILSFCFILFGIIWLKRTSIFMAGIGALLVLLPRYKILKKSLNDDKLAHKLNIEAIDERNRSIDRQALQFTCIIGIILIIITCFVMDFMGRKDISFILSLIAFIQFISYIFLRFYFNKKS